MTRFFDQLRARSIAVDSLLCVGLDPDYRKHRVSEIADFNRAIIEATSPFTACYKPNIAFYEQHGIEGLRQLEKTLAAIPAGVPVIGDVKRGDMGNTAEAYARAMFDSWGFGAVTVNGYQGLDAVAPFLAYEGRGVFVLCRTSNPSSRDLQELRLASGEMVFERMAVTASSWSPNVGLVVGATAPAELRRVRELLPAAPVLVPGIGAQGGSPSEVLAAAGAGPGTIVVSSSRAILYAGEGPGFAKAAGEAARMAAEELRPSPA